MRTIGSWTPISPSNCPKKDATAPYQTTRSHRPIPTTPLAGQLVYMGGSRRAYYSSTRQNKPHKPTTSHDRITGTNVNTGSDVPRQLRACGWKNTFNITGIDRCPALTAPPHRIAADGDSRTQFCRRLATDISSSYAEFRDDWITTERTARSTRSQPWGGGPMSRANCAHAGGTHRLHYGNRPMSRANCDISAVTPVNVSDHGNICPKPPK